MGGAEPAQPFLPADPTVAILIRPDELLAQAVGAGRRRGDLLIAASGRALVREVQALLRSAPGIVGRH